MVDMSSSQSISNKSLSGSNRLVDGTLKSSSNYTISFPNKTCTLAALSDIPDFPDMSSYVDCVSEQKVYN